MLVSRLYPSPYIYLYLYPYLCLCLCLCPHPYLSLPLSLSLTLLLSLPLSLPLYRNGLHTAFTLQAHESSEASDQDLAGLGWLKLRTRPLAGHLPSASAPMRGWPWAREWPLLARLG